MSRFEWRGEQYELVPRSEWTWREASLAEECTGLTSIELDELRNQQKSQFAAVLGWLSVRREHKELPFEEFFDDQMKSVTRVPEPEPTEPPRPMYEGDPEDPTAAEPDGSAATSPTTGRSTSRTSSST